MDLAATLFLAAACVLDPRASGAHAAPDLARPAAGETYTSCYGARVERLTDHSRERVPFIQAEYATQNHFNADGSVVKLEWSDGTVRFLERQERKWLPLVVPRAKSPTWIPDDPRSLLVVEPAGAGVEIRRLDVFTGRSTEERHIAEYVALDDTGESDISPDGTKLAFIGRTRDGARHVVVYDRARGRLSRRVLDVTRHSVNWVQVTDTRVLVGYDLEPASCADDIPEAERYYEEGPRGERQLLGCQPIRIFGTDMEPAWDRGRTLLASYWGHGDVGIDTSDRGREVWVMANASQPSAKRWFASAASPDPERCEASFVRFTLDRPSAPRCLMEGVPAFSWDLAAHVALPAAGSEWAYVTFYRTRGDADDKSAPVPFQNEIVRVRLDGRGFERLAHHHSSRHRGAAYNWTPRASVDASGRLLLFNSNFGGGDSPLSGDVFLLRAPASH